MKKQLNDGTTCSILSEMGVKVPDDEDFNPEDEFDEPEKARALAKFLEINCSELSEGYSSYHFDLGNQSYMVMTDDEADELWDEYLDNYIDECLEIPEHIRFYFDEDSWKSDARMDGRGHSLSSYDGCENEETDPETDELFYIYRT